MAFMALGVAMAYLHPRAIWQRLVLLASTIPIAILCNVVRVTVTGFIYILWDPKYATDIYHDLLGMLMLPLAFGLYGGLAWFMSNLLVDAKEEIQEDIIVRKRTNE
jgi:exosortase/archaeosortase family protein